MNNEGRRDNIIKLKLEINEAKVVKEEDHLIRSIINTLDEVVEKIETHFENSKALSEIGKSFKNKKT